VTSCVPVDPRCPDRSDVICEFPLREMLAFHKERNAEGTLLVTKARDTGCPDLSHDYHISAGLAKPQGPSARCPVSCRNGFNHSPPKLLALYCIRESTQRTASAFLCQPACRHD